MPVIQKNKVEQASCLLSDAWQLGIGNCVAEPQLLPVIRADVFTGTDLLSKISSKGVAKK